jgi:hypothetical protein
MEATDIICPAAPRALTVVNLSTTSGTTGYQMALP